MDAEGFHEAGVEEGQGVEALGGGEGGVGGGRWVLQGGGEGEEFVPQSLLELRVE